MNILEDSRNTLVANSKKAKKERDGKTRYQKRVKSHIANNVKEFNQLNMNELFRDDILTVTIHVHGETDDYYVKISWSGILEALTKELARNNNSNELDLRNIIKALIISFNKNDVYVHCTCPDAQYRMNYWETINKISSGEPELRPSDITNPDNDLGPGCKHVMAVLANTSWLVKVASVIKNYVEYIKKHRENLYADIIYPALYNKKYEEPTQTTIFDADGLQSDQSDIDVANAEARSKGKFKPGNPYRYRRDEKDEGNVQQKISIEDEEE